jgi:hypothetical protein
MTRREESPQPNPPEARMLMGALDAQISVRDIAMWAQIPQSERQNFFSGDRAPCNVSLSPKDGVVYCRTEAKKAVRQWKMNSVIKWQLQHHSRVKKKMTR